MTKAQEAELISRVNRLEKQLNLLLQQKDNMKLDKHLYSVAEVAQILGKTTQAVYGMIERGELETTKLGTTKVLGSCLRKIMKGESE